MAARRAPLVVVLGATACGKSRLAIEIARRFGGEIISADSMQVYKGLDIVTNKVTEEEQRQARHHMINFLDPLSRYSVIDFRNKSLDLINAMHEREVLPIVVGGTNYYIESILWKGFILGPTLKSAKRAFEEPTDGDQEANTLIDSEAKLLGGQAGETLHTQEDLEDVEKFFSKRIYNDGFANVDSVKLWNLLEKVDPKAAHIYHPHDKRRIIRSLQVCQERNSSYTAQLADVNKSEVGEKFSLGGPLRYGDTLVIWLQCDNGTLDKIMDERVDKMLSRGLLAELEGFHDQYNKQRLLDGRKPEYDKGIFQTIGFKEFHDYLMLEPDSCASPEGNEVLRKAIDRMKISTRQYARKQLKWIRRRFLQSGTRDLPVMFKLQTAFDEEGWHERVQKPAFDIVSCFMNNQKLSDELSVYRVEPDKQELINEPGKFHCDVCDRVFIGSVNINSHLNSRTHHKSVERSKRQKRLDLERTAPILDECVQSSS